jgi:hypothetical protein
MQNRVQIQIAAIEPMNIIHPYIQSHQEILLTHLADCVTVKSSNVNLATDRQQMLSHLCLMINKEYLTIPENYEKLIILIFYISL